MGVRLIGTGLLVAVAVSLAGCGSSLSSLSNTLKNPFAKREDILPGERIAVITDQTISVDPAEAGKPIQLPQPQANASWSQPGGTPSNNL